MDNKYGWMEATFLVPCDLPKIEPSKDWITKLLLQNPDLTGWPFFVDLWTPRRADFKPQIRDGIWEAKLDGTDDGMAGLDYWRIDGKQGLFYAARALEDDTYDKNENPRETLEFVLAILRTAEIIAIAIRFSNYLCKDNSDNNANVSLTIKWTGLKGRILSSWAHPGRSLRTREPSNIDSVTTNIEIPLNSTHDQIVVLTQKATKDLFLSFDGWECSIVVFEDLVGKLLNRKL